MQNLNVALVQTNLFWEDTGKNLSMFQEKIHGLPSDIDLVILPEMFTTGFTMFPEKFSLGHKDEVLDWLKKCATENQVAITGSVVVQEGKKFYNRLYFMFPDGKYHSYDKRHTFTLAGEDKVYSSGSEKLLVIYKGWKICPMICYDLRFPVWIRNVEEYDVCIFVANWPNKRQLAWDALLKARAIENMAYCIGVNRVGKDGNGVEYTGHSMIYNGLGEEMLKHPQEAETVLFSVLKKSHIQKIRSSLKFLNDRDEFILK